jgi:hypothetical protein
MQPIRSTTSDPCSQESDDHPLIVAAATLRARGKTAAFRSKRGMADDGAWPGIGRPDRHAMMSATEALLE